MSLKAKLEAVIYAAEEPVTLAQLTTLFTADALEWKAEQAAASAALAAETGNEVPETGELLPLSNGEFAYLEANQAAAVSAPSETFAGPESPAAEPAPEAGADSSQEAGAEAAPETQPETDLEASAEAGSEAEDSAAAELELRRQTRQRDREVRSIIRQLIDELIASYASDGRGVEIREIAGGFRMATKPECHDAVRAFVKSLKPPLKLSLPALETLAVVAYKQPVTAPEVNEIRGVDSSGVFGSLLARKLITTAGRKPVIGRPILYKTTREFLLRFGLKDVTELPSMDEFEKMAAMELEEPELSSSTEPATEPVPEAAPDQSPELDESDDQPGEEFQNVPTETPEPTETAGMAACNESPISEEAAPAAPQATEQAETENTPHGEKDQEEQENR
jgi:segregation and condensation protein B